MKEQKKRSGYVITAELILITTILVIGLITGLVKLRNSVVMELWDTAEAIGTIDQSYEFTGLSITGSVGTIQTAGSVWQDEIDDGTTGGGTGGTDTLPIDQITPDDEVAP